MTIHQRLFYLLLVLIPTQFGLHLWPDWAYVLGRRIDYLSPTLFITDIVLFLVILFWLKDRAFHNAPRSKKNVVMPSGYILLATGFVIVNVLLAASQPVAVYKWIKLLEFILLGWYIISTKQKGATVIPYISLGVLYTSVLAIMQFVVQRSVGGFFWVLGERTFSLDTPGISRFDFCLLEHSPCMLLLRPYATFSHPNVLGGFLATVLPVILFMVLTNTLTIRTLVQRVYYWVVLLLGLVALLITFSRSAWIVGGLGLLTVVILFLSGKHFGTREHVARSVTIVLLLIVTGITWLSIIFAPSATSESVVRRIELNRAAVDMWRVSPVFGKGLGNFMIVLPESDVSRYINFIQPAHNIFLLALAEVGVAGIAGIIIFFWYMIKSARFYRGTIPLWFAACGYFLVIGSIDHYPVTLQQGQLWSVVLLGLILKR